MARLDGKCLILAVVSFAICDIAFFYLVGPFDRNSAASIRAFLKAASGAE